MGPYFRRPSLGGPTKYPLPGSKQVLRLAAFVVRFEGRARCVSGFAADEIRAASVDTPQRSVDYRVERLAFSVVNY